MKIPPRRLVVLLLACALGAGGVAAQAADVRFALIRTAQQETPEALTVAGGEWTRTVLINHVAVLIQHPRGTLLLDTGLGRQVDQQFNGEVPWYARPLMGYGPVTPARDQLQAAGIRIERILLTHAHWDHVSGLVDFPGVPVLAPQPEIDFSRNARPPAVLPGQFAHGVDWQPLRFDDKPFMGFAQSLDLYADGSLVAVPLQGHTPGSIGLFVTLADGRRFFFTGDTSWRLQGFSQPAAKNWLASRLADFDREATLAQLHKVHALMQAHPQLQVVPAHDEEVQRELGYFPQWIGSSRD
jgi:glyoxylase-like metal-dependent hydrolase (beta-lactamase superfamily II)